MPQTRCSCGKLAPRLCAGTIAINSLCEVAEAYDVDLDKLGRGREDLP